jgi:hypothetical protein
MKAAIYAQLNPDKTMSELIGDRFALQLGIISWVLFATFC